MTYIETEISGVWIIEPKVFKDARGYFMEAWKKAEFEEHIGKVEFVQDNESCSSKVCYEDCITNWLLTHSPSWYV